MKCLISDFDGTLYDTNFKKNIDKIRDFVKNGNIFIINTGRTYFGLKNAIKDYDIPYKYLICSDGACIYDSNDKKIYEVSLNKELKLNIMNTIMNDKTSFISFDNNYDIVSNDANNISRIFIKRSNYDSDLERVNELNKNSNIKAYLSEHWINILDKKVNKLTAIDYLKQIDNLGEIYTIGDSINDIEMLLNYNGYLMQNNEVGNSYNIPTIISVEKLIEKIEKDI